ncbi:MAG TPA: hypothetical protein VGK94_07905 [Candidatus Polarisedimenticolia bacterium]|jgi:hypothetical protein
MAARDIDLLTSAAQTATAQGGEKTIPTLTMAAVTVDVTAKSGTGTPTLSVWLQGKVMFNGVEIWVDIPYDVLLVHEMSPTTADQAAITPSEDVVTTARGRNIVNVYTGTPPARFTAIYKHLSYLAVRLAWAISGTTPSFTFAAALSGK